MNFKSLILALLLPAISISTGAQTKITSLRTEYQQNPLGIEVSSPRLSWQMDSKAYGAAQTAYRVVAALSENDLASQNYIYDSGKVLSMESVAVPYEGKISPETRYFWKVYVWDQKGKISESSTAFFETGLVNNNWSGAQWIGSNKIILSQYRADFVIDYDVRSTTGEGTFVFGARDDKNYVSCTLNTIDKSMTFSYKKDGVKYEAQELDCSEILGGQSSSASHHVTLTVTSDGKNYTVIPSIDFVQLSRRGVAVNIHDASSNTNLERLYNIGYDQAPSQKAEFSNIAISENQWKTTFVTDNSVINAEGFKTWSVVNASAPMLRKEVTLKSGIKSARLYATARGIYEMEINGELVSDDYYSPGWSVYGKRMFYLTYDITDKLKAGKNVIGATLGSGWWNDFVGMYTDPYGLSQSLIAKMVVTYEDGSRQIIVTDDSWKVFDDGPVVANSMQTGEDYDARKEIPGWSKPGFDDSKWKSVKVFDAPSSTVKIQAYIGEPIRVSDVLVAKSMAEPKKGVYIYDMGQNMVGIPEILNLNGKAGQKVTIRFAEMLWPDIIPENPIEPYTKEDYQQNKGLLYTDNYRLALSRDIYYMKGTGNEKFTPSLTQHGYRYVEITGIDQPLPLSSVTGLVLNSVGQVRSHYETSDERINQLFSNIIWGEKGNFLSVPTDCPQRNERMGWTGDAQVFSNTACYNMMTDSFYTRWMNSLRDNQGANGSYPNTVPSTTDGGDAMGWMEAGTVVPFNVYLQYGDKNILAEQYESMKKYVAYLDKRAQDMIQPAGIFGDWLAVQYTDISLTNTAYYVYDVELIGKVAKILGKDDEAAQYAEHYKEIKEAWNKTFVDETGHTKGIGAGMPAWMNMVFPGKFGVARTNEEHPEWIDSQTSYALPLQLGVFSEENIPAAVEHLAEAVRRDNNVLSTGFIGTPALCTVLSKYGHSDLAYALFEQTVCPSWLFPVLQGATTIWERWNSYTITEGFGPVEMNSFNHYSYGAIEDWMMGNSIGIQKDEQNPGYKHFVLAPEVGGSCEFIHGGFESMYGMIESGWDKTSTGYTYNCTVPANSTATFKVPVVKASDVVVKKGAKGITSKAYKNGYAILELSAGDYSFQIK